MASKLCGDLCSQRRVRHLQPSHFLLGLGAWADDGHRLFPLLLIAAELSEPGHRQHDGLTITCAHILQAAISSPAEFLPPHTLSIEHNKLVLNLVPSTNGQRNVCRMTIKLKLIHCQCVLNAPRAKLWATADYNYATVCTALRSTCYAEAYKRGAGSDLRRRQGHGIELLAELCIVACAGHRIFSEGFAEPGPRALQGIKIKECRGAGAGHDMLHLPVSQTKDVCQVTTHGAHATTHARIAMTVNHMPFPQETGEGVRGLWQHPCAAIRAHVRGRRPDIQHTSAVVLAANGLRVALHANSCHTIPLAIFHRLKVRYASDT
mmetsp:Transcript_18860/g.50194  ORF Transcript_18860/g.50194 Transcript_18860/m.50194 type:complete len:320 (-) Transcript_18860:528-1487(-)